MRATHTYIRDFTTLVVIIISIAFYDVSTFVFHSHSSLGHSPLVFSSLQLLALASFLTGPINGLRCFPVGLFITLSIINTVRPLQTSEYVFYRFLSFYSNGIPSFFKLLGFFKIYKYNTQHNGLDGKLGPVAEQISVGERKSDTSGRHAYYESITVLVQKRVHF